MVGNRGVNAGNKQSTSTVPERILSTLLNEMDGVESNSVGRVLIIAATNQSPKGLDRALVRSGRFDKHLYVPPPQTKEERVKILEVHTRDMQLSADVQLPRLADLIDRDDVYFTGADIRGWCREAAMCALRANLDADVVVRVSACGLTLQTMENFVEALAEVRPSVSAEMLARYF